MHKIFPWYFEAKKCEKNCLLQYNYSIFANGRWNESPPKQNINIHNTKFMMKKLQLSVILLSVIALAFTGCKASSSKSAAIADSTQANNAETLVTDSFVSIQKGDSSLSCKVIVDYPTEPDSLSMAVREYISQELAKNYLPYSDEESVANKYPKFSGDLSKGQALVDYYGKGNFKYLKEEQAGIEPLAAVKPSLEYEAEIRKIGETATYITYKTFTYNYQAGAHGATTEYAVNINKATRKVMAQTVDTLKVKEMQPLLRKGVLSYFKERGEKEVNEKNLNEYLFIENGIIPMPTKTPFLAKDGVHFIYQQYEIGAYAIGMVSFVIPYSDIKPYLTAEALKLTK